MTRLVLVRSRSWRPSASALGLLEDAGGPFDVAAFRRSFIGAFPGWVDVSYGAVLPDGTTAAIALLRFDRIAESVPYNYGAVVATRALGEQAMNAFLEQARRSCGAASLISRWVPVRPAERDCHIGGRVAGWTSVVYLDKAGMFERRLAQKARRSMRIAERAGGEVGRTTDVEDFLQLYRASWQGHWLRYPDPLIRGLAQEGLARCYNVAIAGRAVSSVLVLTSNSHWTAWLAAQDEQGRAANANYLAVAGMLKDAERERVRAVNLGISAELPGVAHFKRRFDAVDVPVVEYRLATTSERLRALTRTAAAAASRRGRRLMSPAPSGHLRGPRRDA